MQEEGRGGDSVMLVVVVVMEGVVDVFRGGCDEVISVATLVVVVGHASNGSGTSGGDTSGNGTSEFDTSGKSTRGESTSGSTNKW